MKFTVDGTLVASEPSAESDAEADQHPLGKALFAVDGVRALFAVNDFVTVTKEDGASWAAVGPAVTEAIKQSLA